MSRLLLQTPQCTWLMSTSLRMHNLLPTESNARGLCLKRRVLLAALVARTKRCSIPTRYGCLPTPVEYLTIFLVWGGSVNDLGCAGLKFYSIVTAARLAITWQYRYS